MNPSTLPCSNMIPIDRCHWRNVLVYASKNRDVVLGGLRATAGVTNANLYSMVEIFCSISEAFYLHDDREELVERNGRRVRLGKYYIVTNGSINLTDEVPINRLISMKSGTHVAPFRNAVRERDGRCVITGKQDRVGRFRALQAAHVFPLAQLDKWEDDDFGRWINIPPHLESHGSINSVQNGILLRSDMHCFFDAYEVTINPDDNYKIVCFTPDLDDYNVADRHLDQDFINNPLRPVDEVLRWHFRQAVLANVKGAYEPNCGGASGVVCAVVGSAGARE